MQEVVSINDKIETLGNIGKDMTLSLDKSLIKGTLADFNNENSEETYKALKTLETMVSSLSPSANKSLLNPGFFQKLFRINTVQKYVDKYKSAQSVIDEIVKTLDVSKKSLYNDNVTLQKQCLLLKKDFETVSNTLEELQAFEKSIHEELEKAEATNDEEIVEHVKSSLLFPCLQKITDTQQKMAIVKQSTLVLSTLIKNNHELIEGVDRAKSVTLNALGLSILITQSLNEQKKVMDVITGLNETTSDLILSTSIILKEQGAEIQKQASRAMLDPEKLEQAFKEAIDALNSINQHRSAATLQLAEECKRLDEISKSMNNDMNRLFESVANKSAQGQIQ